MNFASICFASKQKLLNRSEAKNLKRKKANKMQKIEEKSGKKRKKGKKYTWISLSFVSLRSENYSSEAKRKIWSENKRKMRSEIL